MTHNKRLTDKLMDIARWYSMPADHFNVVKEAVKMLESAPSVSCSEKPNRCEDAVSRQAVLEGLASIAKAKAKSDAQKAMMGRTMFFVEQLPSASTEKTGRWIAQDIHNCHTDFKCSECGYIHSFMHLYGEPTADYTYCPNCGSYNGGGNNGNE